VVLASGSGPGRRVVPGRERLVRDTLRPGGCAPWPSVQSFVRFPSCPPPGRTLVGDPHDPASWDPLRPVARSGRRTGRDGGAARAGRRHRWVAVGV